MGKVYCDGRLPFGLRSSAKLFNAVADALEWIIRERGVHHIAHYLDDFVVLGSPASSECADSLATMTRACADLGVPLAEEKSEGPASVITFLGILVDTVKGIVYPFHLRNFNVSTRSCTPGVIGSRAHGRNSSLLIKSRVQSGQTCMVAHFFVE